MTARRIPRGFHAWRRVGLTALLLTVPRGVHAQWGVWKADSLLAAGRIQAAESAYYAAARYRPRDPRARAALGRYLAARGAPKVGAVLLEEARQFGGDSAALGVALVPMYARAGDYRSLAELRPDVISEPARRRARWLSENPEVARFADSVAVLTYRPLGDGRGIGTVLLRLGRSELPATIDPRVTGLVLPAGSPGETRAFGREGSRTLAVLRSVRVGGVEFTNVPVTIEAAGEPVRIGFDVLARLMPSFDPVAGLLTLRRVDRRSRPPDGVHLPTLFDGNGLRLLIGGRWHPTTSANASLLLASRRWTWDDRNADVVLMP